MEISISRALLRQLRDQLIADATLLAWYRGRVRRRALSRRVRLLIEEHVRTEATPDLVAATRLYWENDPGVRLDEKGRQRIDRDGIWISGWLRARTGVAAYDRIDPARFASAVAELGPLARQVFILHSRENLDYERIATRLGMSVQDVQNEFASALLAVDRALNGGPLATDGDGSNFIA